MKYLAILTLVAAAFGLGACANDDSHATTTSHTGTTTSAYSK